MSQGWSHLVVRKSGRQSPRCGGGAGKVCGNPQTRMELGPGAWFPWVIHGFAASPSPGNLLELPILRGLPRPTESETLETGSRNLRANKSSR